MFAFAIWAVAVQHRRRRGARKRSVVSHITPQPAGLGASPRPGSSTGTGGVVGVNTVCGHHVCAYNVHQRTQQARALANPIGQGGTVQFDTGAGVDLGLAIERAMISVFRDQHMRQQSWCRQATPNGQARDLGLRDGLAVAAGQFRPHVADDTEAGRRVVQYFGHVFAERTQRAAAVRTGAGSGVLDHLTRQTFRQWPADRFPPGRVAW